MKKFNRINAMKQFFLLTFRIFVFLFVVSMTVYFCKTCGKITETEEATTILPETTTTLPETTVTKPSENLQEPTEKTVKVAENSVKPTEIAVKNDSLGEFRITAYCSCAVCCGEYAYNRPTDENGNPIVYGASGERLRQGVSVAADTSVLPFGTEILIDGHTYIVQDVGGAIKGNRIDVYFENHPDALAFGVKYATVKRK